MYTIIVHRKNYLDEIDKLLTLETAISSKVTHKEWIK